MIKLLICILNILIDAFDIVGFFCNAMYFIFCIY